MIVSFLQEPWVDRCDWSEVGGKRGKKNLSSNSTSTHSSLNIPQVTSMVTNVIRCVSIDGHIGFVDNDCVEPVHVVSLTKPTVNTTPSSTMNHLFQRRTGWRDLADHRIRLDDRFSLQRSRRTRPRPSSNSYRRRWSVHLSRIWRIHFIWVYQVKPLVMSRVWIRLNRLPHQFKQ